MKPKLTPKVLATGLFKVAEDSKNLNQVKNALMQLKELVLDNGQFHVFIQSKKIDGKSKAEILNTILGESGHPLVNELVSYLSGSSAPDQLKKISLLFESMYREKRNIIEVKGLVSHEMSESQVNTLKISLDRILGKQTELSIEVDPALIGGIKLRIDNTFLDASIQNQLQILQTELLQI